MVDQTEIDRAIYKAIKTAGTQQKLADIVGVSKMAVSLWRKKGHIPAEHILKIEKATGVSRHKLRPDIYPLEDA
jgi:DNA-binding transcriptional regulator YdaS (Cro superfamily)